MTEVLKMLPSAYGLGQYFQDLGHSFSPYGPPSRQITYLSKFVKIQKSYFICYGFGSLHGVLIRPITLERASRKALKCVMVMEK